MNTITKAVAALCLLLPIIGWAQVDINKASASELAAELKGIGKSKAEAIIAYREENGPFKAADELVNVKGIGLTTVNNNRDNIKVDATQKDTKAAPQAKAATKK